MISGRRRSVIFFTVLGTCLVAIAVALNVGWLVINWTRGVLALLGLIFFLVIIAGMVLNTIFLVREIRRNEQHDSFINAVTHELKTPVASIRLYLQTLQSRDLDESKRQEFYRIMLDDSDRLLHTIEQVLRAGSTRSPLPAHRADAVSISASSRPTVWRSRERGSTWHEEAMRFEPRISAPAIVLGDADELKAAVWNLIDNAVKYSTSNPQVSVTLEETADRSRYALKVADQRAGDLPERVEARVPPLLPHPRHVCPREGQRPRAVHRPLGGAQARRQGVRRE